MHGTHAAVVVGTGFSGIAAAVRLREAGVDVVVLEASEGIGGTWRANTYPGCACDVPSHLYSLSFAPDPGWSHRYARQPEILAYLERVVDETGLRPHIRLSTALTAARWDADEAVWLLETTGGPMRARSLVGAFGPLRRPRVPALPDAFAGPAFHTARWDHSVDLGGKRVAVIGTGASAIQVVPQIAPEVAELVLFQRTPPWVIPRKDRAFTPRAQWLNRHVPGLLWLRRAWVYAYQELYGSGLLGNPVSRQVGLAKARWHRESQIPDPELRAQVTPRYALGCKRVLLSDDYYPALSRQDVHLVPHGVRALTEHGVVDATGREHPVDVVVWATGFVTPDRLPGVDLVGRDGLTLGEAWRDRVEAFEGTMVHGFPNLYLLLGPNTGLGHNSVVFMAEAQTERIVQAVGRVEQGDARWVEVRAEAQDAFNHELQSRLSDSVWASGCDSWYVEDGGHNPTLWPGTTMEFWRRLRRWPGHALQLG